jgi:single-stranded DNA-specific DHH superfamily exonuclease
MLENLKGKGLLIHHWDTDGICSARLFLEKLSDKDITNKTPELGNYFLTDQELEDYSKFDFVIVTDMSMPEDNILRLAKNAEVMIFDHHLGKVIEQVFHNNPVIKGENPDKYPSTSWIVNDYLGNELNLFGLLGIIGDHEQKIKNNQEFFKLITDFCNERDLNFEDMLKMAYLLDSNYKIGDKSAVEKAPNLLLENGTVDFIMNNHNWNDNYNKLIQELEKQQNMPYDEINGIILKKINTSYNIISSLTRKVAWSSGKNTIVINTGFFNDRDQVYIRSKKNAEPMITRGKELGYKCGGKKEVLGAIVPKKQTDTFVQEIIEYLKN